MRNAYFKFKNIFFGLLLIALAVCLILWKLDVFHMPAAVAGVSTWALVVSAIMVIVIVHSILDLSFGGIFIPLAVICIMFDGPLGITAITPWIVIIAAVLLTVAFNLLFSRRRRFHGHRHGDFDNYRGESFSESTDDEHGHVTHTMKFGSATKYVHSGNLRSADLSSSFGELGVFFEDATAADNNVLINCRVSFGEMDLYIPKDWYVDNRISVSLGNCDDSCSASNPAEHSVICRIEGNVAFGELKLVRI